MTGPECAVECVKWAGWYLCWYAVWRGIFGCGQILMVQTEKEKKKPNASLN